MQAMEISRTGLDVEWRRLEVIAENLANLNTTRTALGEPYQAMRLLSGPKASFKDFMGQAPKGGALAGVAVYGIEPTHQAPRTVYEPTHPHANADGFVSYPAIDHGAEMALMVKTARAYEANLVAMTAARQMYVKAMELGKRA
jgi:flagellar basal-body rod protein FlgC